MFADNWCIKSNDRVYGPYSSNDLRKFAHEGRFASWSLVAPAGSSDWKEARQEPTFAQFFGFSAEAANERSFGKLKQSPDAAQAASHQPVEEPRRAHLLGRDTRTQLMTEQTAMANFVVIFDATNAAGNRVESALTRLGLAFRLADNVWSVSCRLTAIGVRNAISPFLRPNETLFVIDATNGRTSWQNYAPEAHAKISQTYVHGRSA
jgi:hypothetical protein